MKKILLRLGWLNNSWFKVKINDADQDDSKTWRFSLNNMAFMRQKHIVCNGRITFFLSG